MIKSYTTDSESGFEWIDLVSPDRAEVQQVAGRFGLHEASVEDALQPDHLPKFEKLRTYSFVIMRIYSVYRESQADTVQELTDKLAIFFSEKFIVTVHKHEWKDLEAVNEEFLRTGDCKNAFHLFNEIVRYGLLTFDEPGAKLNRTIDYLEEKVFLKNKNAPLLKSMYFLKRKVDVIRRVLLLSNDIIDHIDPPGTSDEYTRDIRDLYVKQQSIFDSLAENTNHLVGIYFNISSQRTNETIRVLTIFSVFFMPLTFIVGIYGMNFEFMPELRQKWGYPGVMVLMLVIVLAIYTWFKRKNWL
ncbi:magnesium transporter CorA family protein [Flavitalea antarctica]